jgi:ribonucleoside-diphosphate reductase alpha chain
MQKIQNIVKRDGRKVSFDATRIANAIHKAFLSESIADKETVVRLTHNVVKILEASIKDQPVVDVEKTQDIVEKVLIEKGHHKIAKNYILYREQHKKERQEKTLAKIKNKKLKISLSDGKSVTYNVEKTQEHLTSLAKGLSHVSIPEILSSIHQHIYDEVSLKDFQLIKINASREKIEHHYDYSYLTSRIVLNKLYESILDTQFASDTLKQTYGKAFSAYIKKGVELDMLSPVLEQYDHSVLIQALNPQHDCLFMYLGLQILEDRYLLRDRTDEQNIFELPQWMWMRVAMGLAQNENKKEERAIEFYNILSQMDLISSTPTLFNSGTTHSQMSSCYINTVEDSLDGIFKTYGDNASLSKWAGGIGTDWTPIRSTGSKIHGTNGLSQGVIPFIKIFNDVALAVNQGGKRKGAMAAYMEVWHRDIEQFYELRKNTGDERRRAHDINTACWIPDLFMKRVKENGKWTLFSPSEVPDLHDLYGKEFEKRYEYYESQNLSTARELKAVDLWKKHLTMLYETGHPWITFKDPINVRSPQDHCGRVHSSNLCTEITLNTSIEETAVCNLASINLGHMIKNGELDTEKIAKTVEIGIRMLDNVIDNNFYPTKEAKTANMRHRPIGLGMMGYQDALYQCNIHFDSEENLEFADRSMEMVSYYAILGSSKIAKERGPYQSYISSKWDRGIFPYDTLALLEEERGQKLPISKAQRLDWTRVKAHVKEYGMRNSNTMAIAPTATIANIAGVMPCTEPAYKNIYMKENLSGNFIVINKNLIDDLEKEGLWNKNILNQIKLNDGSVQKIKNIPQDIRKKYKEVFEIAPLWIIKASALRGKWIDQSASTNVFINTTSGKVLSDVYQTAWELGLKTTYYLRNKGASQITKTVKGATLGNTALSEPNTLEENSETDIQACLINEADCEACQ